MTPHRKLIVVAISSFLAGGLLIGTAAFLFYDGVLNSVLGNNYISSFYVNAAEAQFDVRSLSRLRSGKVEKVISDLDLLLNAHTIQLADYEKFVPGDKRQPFVYQALAEVRAYRDKYPAHFDYPAQEAAYQKALALGKKGRGSNYRWSGP